MNPLTPREMALLSYFYAVSTDPRVRAAGYSVVRVKNAVLACLAEDLPGVLAFALRTAVDRVAPAARRVAGGIARDALRGEVPAGAADHLAGAAEELVGEGLRRAGAFVDALVERGKRRS